MSKNESAALSVKQWRCVRALLTRPTVAQAAVDCALSEATIYRWLATPAFRQALAQAEGEAVAAAGRRLAALAETALDVVRDILTDPQAPDAVRVRAAELILSHLIRYREVSQFENRLAALEQEMRGG